MAKRSSKPKPERRAPGLVITPPVARPSDGVFNPFREAKEAETTAHNTDKQDLSLTDYAPPKSVSHPNSPPQALQNGWHPHSVRHPDSDNPRSNSLSNSDNLADAESLRLMEGLPALEGYMRFWHQMTDHLYAQLTLAEQSIHIQLFRLSWGRGFPTCKIGLSRLCERTGIKSPTTTHAALRGLIKKGLVRKISVELGKGKEQGIEYFVVPPPASVEKLSSTESVRLTNYGSLTEFGCHPDSDTYKDNTYKHNTQTQTGVGVNSKFSPEECRKYAAHLRTTGQGITNPGGYATKIHRSGEADESIAAFLAVSEPSVRPDFSLCPDCGGTGYFYPNGREHGVAKCRHEKL